MENFIDFILNLNFVKIVVENLIPYIIICLITFWLNKRLTIQSILMQKQNSLKLNVFQNDSKYLDKLNDISGELISNYKSLNDDETFDNQDRLLRKNMLALFSTFDAVYSLHQVSAVSNSTFEYWDSTITKMLMEKFYVEGWKYCNNQDYYSKEFIDFIDGKIFKENEKKV